MKLKLKLVDKKRLTYEEKLAEDKQNLPRISRSSPRRRRSPPRLRWIQPE